MYKQIRFFIKNIFRIAITFLVSLIFKRDKNILIMGQRKPKVKIIKTQNDYFMHNTKYLFLYLNQTKQDNLKLIYLCDDKKMLKTFYDKGYKNVYPRKSIKGIYYALKAKYWLYDDSKFSVFNEILSGKAICINLWHGIPLKKIGYDITGNYKKYNKFQKKLYDLLRDKDSYYNVNSEYEQYYYESAFLTPPENINILGSPRLDVLLNDIPNADLFMEKDCNAVKNYKKQGKKIFIYMPTFRDTGKDISSWLKSENLKQFLQKNNIILVCKLHFADKNSLNFELTENFYKMDNDSDVYQILKYTDCLISDYSSVYFDYLLLDKPILYYVPDLEEYQKKCRGFYESYEELTAGRKSINEEELLSAMQDVINGIDNYKEQRKALRNKMFVHQDGKNCERIVEWIKSLD